MEKKTLLLGFAVLALTGCALIPFIRGSISTIEKASAVANTFVFDKDHQLSAANFTEGETSSDYVEDYALANGKIITIIGESWYGSTYQTNTFDSATNFFESNYFNDSTSTAVYLEFDIIGLTSVSWVASQTKLTDYYGPFFTLDIIDSSTNSLATSSTIGDGSLNVSSGCSAYAKFSFSYYASLNIESITFSYNCVGL